LVIGVAHAVQQGNGRQKERLARYNFGIVYAG